MISWGKIDNVLFEEIAYKYMIDKYPNVKWEKTKLTRDGNKDGEYILDNLPMGVVIKYWYEAKFSINFTQSIKKSHLDSTLVSSALDGNVHVISFITNAYISEDYKRRADVFSRQRNNTKIIYINGQEIENWLSVRKDVENEYFCDNSAKFKVDIDKIVDVCILCNSVNDSDLFKALKIVEVDKHYILFISYYSNSNQFIRLVFSDTVIPLEPYGRDYDNYDNLNVNFGRNCFYIPVKFIETNHELISFSMYNGLNLLHDYTIKNLKIISVYNPTIHYAEQNRISLEINNLIQDKDVSNAICLISGNAGFGKSTIINTIISNHRNPFSHILLKFTNNDNYDVLLCYKIIVYSIYGDIWNFSFESIQDIFAIKQTIILMIMEIQNNTYTEQTFIKVSNMLLDSNLCGCPQEIQTQIYIDDLHKISAKSESLFIKLSNFFSNKNYNSKMFIFSRPFSNSHPNLYDKLSCLSCYNTSINTLTISDIQASFKTNFCNIPYLINIVPQYPVPINTLNLINIMNEINNKKNYLCLRNDIELALEYRQIYQKISATSGFAISKQIVNAFQTYEIVNSVYKFKDGIFTEAIGEYYGNASYQEIYYLCKERIIKEVGSKLYPYHDIYVDVYFAQKRNTIKNKFEDFVLFCFREEYVEQFSMLSLLISLNDKNIWKYRKEAMECRDNLYRNADYYQAYKIADALNSYYQNSNSSYDVEKLHNLFIYANCFKYIKSYGAANKALEEISSFYHVNINDDYFGIYLETQTEIINNCIWMLQISKAQSILFAIKKDIVKLEKNNNIDTHALIYGYLNYYNRMMFVKYMLDEGTERDFFLACDMAIELNKEEYIGFAQMDYAKSLYISNINCSYNYLLEAEQCFIRTSEKRRLLDVKSEIIFLDELSKKNYNYNGLIQLKRSMTICHYFQSQIKIQLKIILFKLLQGESSSEILKMLHKIIAEIIGQTIGERQLAFIYHISALACYLDNNIKKVIDYSSKSLALFTELGPSYTLIQKNNMQVKVKTKIEFCYEWNNVICDNFIIDIRLW